jgi:hypothetical protein
MANPGRGFGLTTQDADSRLTLRLLGNATRRENSVFQFRVVLSAPARGVAGW